MRIVLVHPTDRNTGPFRRALDAQGVEFSFAQIEGIINALLPNAAAEWEWWSAHAGTDRRAPHRRVWIGFDAIAEPRDERVYFQIRRGN